MTFTPTDPTQAEVRVTGTAPNQQLDFYFPQGPKGDPGGITYGTDLATSDLNAIVTPGVYRQSNGSNSTLLAHYPLANAIGALVIYAAWADTSRIEQEFRPIISGESSRVVYKRTLYSGTWTAWHAYNSTRTDQTAGRAIYQWDDVNSREQLIYGDTGVRRIETLLLNGWTGAIVALRRVGNVVSFGVYNLSPAAQTGTIAYTLPVGFRPAGFGGNTAYPVKTANVICDWMNLDSAGNIMPPISSGIVGSGFICVNSWTTNDTWPTTLPGTASGSIPNV